MQIALLDKAHFPRDKYCGDAVCTPAINLLSEMGVLKELQDNNEVHFADNGGFISPSGISYIGKSCSWYPDIDLMLLSGLSVRLDYTYDFHALQSSGLTAPPQKRGDMLQSSMLPDCCRSLRRKAGRSGSLCSEED